MSEEVKSIDSYISGLKKKFGNTSICRLGSEEKMMDVKFRSSGSLQVDLATGGGLAKSRLIEFMGSEASGKCITGDTYVLTSTGYKTIHDILDELNITKMVKPHAIELKYPLINRYGEIEHTSHITLNGKRKLIKVVTDRGTELKVTSNHPLLVLDILRVMVWKRACDLNTGDIIISRKGDMASSGKELISDTEAYLLGMLVADGHFGEYRLQFTNDNEYLKDYFMSNIGKLKHLEGIAIKQYNNNEKGSIDYHLSSKEFIPKFYDYYGLVSGKAKDKYVPNIVLDSSIETQVAFIRGYMDCESYVSKKYDIDVISASNKLIRQIQVMLKNIGITSKVRNKVVKGYEQNTYTRLTINTDFIEYVTNIGSALSESVVNKVAPHVIKSKSIPNIKELVALYYASTDANDRSRSACQFVTDIRSGKCDCTINKLTELLKLNGDTQLKILLEQLIDPHIGFERVTTTEELPHEMTYDFVMPNTHSFIAEGIVNHNTSLACLAIAEAQISEPDKENAIIDIEQAFNIEWAKTLGVDTDKLYISQPDTYAEKIFELIEDLIASDRFAFIVVDSVAGLVTKDEFEETNWDKASRVGGTSGLMTKAMRRLINTGLLNRSDTTVIFINQLRDKIGGFSMYGPSTDTPCGRALKHNGTQRLEVKKGELFTKGSGSNKEVLGNKIKIKVVKNKVAPPYKTAELDLFYSTGVDRIKELVDVAKAINVLNGTSWLTIINPSTGEVLKDKKGEEFKFHGTVKAIEAIKEDVTAGGELYDTIFDLVNEALRS